jgi:hypothetical protein
MPRRTTHRCRIASLIISRTNRDRVIRALKSRDFVASANVCVAQRIYFFAYSRIGYMLPDPQSPLLSSPGKESADSVRMLSSPGTGATGSAPDGGKPRTRSVAAILCDASNPFDRNSCIVTPFDNEAMRDMEFYQS